MTDYIINTAEDNKSCIEVSVDGNVVRLIKTRGNINRSVITALKAMVAQAEILFGEPADKLATQDTLAASEDQA